MSEPYCHISGRGPVILALQIVTFVLSSLAVSLRTYVRGFLIKQFGVDDCFVIFGYVFFTVYLALLTVATCYGLGEHIYVPTVAMRNYTVHKVRCPTYRSLTQTHSICGKMPWVRTDNILQFELIGIIFYIVSNVFVKLSIALQLKRFTFDSKKMNWTIYITMAIFLSACLANLTSLLVFCRPFSWFWTHYEGVEDGHCLNIEVVSIPGYVTAGALCITDWVLAILPFFLIKNLPSAARRTKTMVVITLSIGSM